MTANNGPETSAAELFHKSGYTLTADDRIDCGASGVIAVTGDCVGQLEFTIGSRPSHLFNTQDGFLALYRAGPTIAAVSDLGVATVHGPGSAVPLPSNTGSPPRPDKLLPLPSVLLAQCDTPVDERPLRYTRLTADGDDVLAKVVRLKSDGSGIDKTSPGIPKAAGAVVEEARDVKDFVHRLPDLSKQCAIVQGTPLDGRPPGEPFRVISAGLWEPDGAEEKAGRVLTRTQDHFHFPEDQRGHWVLDYDPPEGAEPLAPEHVVARLRQACPALDDVTIWSIPSAGSHIFAPDGRELVGRRGQRLYIEVARASDLPVFSERLQTYLQAAGERFADVVRVEPSAAGTPLVRTLIDPAPVQPQAIDFAAGAVGLDGVYQNRGLPEKHSGELSRLPEDHIPAPSKDVAEAARQQVEARKAAIQDECDRIREERIEAETRERAGRDGRAEDAEYVEALRTSLRAKYESSVLYGDQEITVVLHGQQFIKTVQQVLAAPLTYDGKVCLDPVEPEYRGERVVGKLYLDENPTLFSFAHGGRTYKLVRQPSGICHDGKRPRREIIDDTWAALSREPDVFAYNNRLAFVLGGQLRIAGEDRMMPSHLKDQLSRRFFYWADVEDKDGNTKRQEVPAAPDDRVVMAISGADTRAGLRPLVGIEHQPVMRPDMTVASTPGYDAATKLYLHFDPADFPAIPEHPTREQAMAALDALWLPFAEFPYITPTDRTAVLATALTAVVRGSLPTAPMLAVSAITHEAQNTGKTLLTKCLSILRSGVKPAERSWKVDEEEVNKEVLTLIDRGTLSCVFDNVAQSVEVNSDTLTWFLSSEYPEGRRLGANSDIGGPNRVLMMMTGNNLKLGGELAGRRTLLCKLDPTIDGRGVGNYRTNFTLGETPDTYIMQNRPALIAAALTLFRAAAPDLGKIAPVGLGSFEEWERVIRRTVVWVHTTLGRTDFVDPLNASVASKEADEEIRRTDGILRELERAFEDRAFTASEVAERLTGQRVRPDDGLREVFGHASASDVGRRLRRIGEKGGVNGRRLAPPDRRRRYRIVRNDLEAEIIPLDEHRPIDEAHPTTVDATAYHVALGSASATETDSEIPF